MNGNKIRILCCVIVEFVLANFVQDVSYFGAIDKIKKNHTKIAAW